MSNVSLPRMAAGVACLLMLAASPAFAEDQAGSTTDAGHKHGPRRSPSPEARKALADACSDKSEGNDCSVEFDEHTLNGTCAKSEQAGTLFCRPEMHRPMGAALEACKDKNENDDCSFARREGDGNIDGHCEKAPPPAQRTHREGADDGHDNNGDHPTWGDHKQGGEQRERPLVCMPERDGD
jgi:hypothetical protein